MNLSHSKVIDLGDFSDPDLTPFLRTAASEDTSAPAQGQQDSHHWECAMMLRAFDAHGVTAPGAVFAGIGAGISQAAFMLAAKGCVVFPCDRYLDVTPRSNLAPAGMMVRPEQYSSLPFERGSVIPVHGDPRALNLPSEFFDGVYSMNAVERLGSLDAVAAAVEEIARILKPGGLASLVTSFRLEGPNDQPWFDAGQILFTPDLIQRHIVAASGLELIGDLDTRISEPTFDRRAALHDFASAADDGRSVEDKRDGTPNLVLFHRGYLFCSVHLALRKPARSEPAGSSRHAGLFVPLVEMQAVATSGALTGQIKDWTKRFRQTAKTEPDPALRRVPRTELDAANRATEVLAQKFGQLELMAIALVEPRAQDQAETPVPVLREALQQAERNTQALHHKAEQAEFIVASLLHSLAQVTGKTERTILQDIRHENPDVDFRGLQWAEIFRAKPEQVSTAIGTLQGSVLRSEGRAGRLAFGPYLTLSAGLYRVTLDLALFAGVQDKGKVVVDVCYEGSTTVAVVREVAWKDLNQPVTMDVRLPRRVEEFEVRIEVPAGADIGLRGMHIDRQQLAPAEMPRHGDKAFSVLETLRRLPGFPFMDLHWTTLHDHQPQDLPTQVGKVTGGVLRADGRPGYLTFGPYNTLSPGRYRVTVALTPASQDGTVRLDVCHDHASAIAAASQFQAHDCGEAVSLEFDLFRTAKTVEVRTLVPDGSDLGVRGIRIEQRRFATGEPHRE